jgi:hypothetical protein
MGRLVNLSFPEVSNVAGLWWGVEAATDPVEPKAERGEDQEGSPREEFNLRGTRIQS